MGKNWQKEFAQKWAKYWPAPARPTAGSLAFLKKTIEDFPKDKPNILILGSTSEFRDMLIDMDIRPTVVDFSRDNYEILSSAMKYKNDYASHEDYIEADWCTMDLQKQFDIILADVVFNIVPKDLNKILLENIKKHLAPEGIFIDRIHFIPDGAERDFDFYEEVKKRKDNIIKHSLYEVFCTPMYMVACEKLLEPVSLKKVANVAEDVYKKGLISKEKLEEYRKLGIHETDSEFFLPTKKFINERMGEFFEIKEVFIDSEWPFYNDFFQNYVMKKK